MIINIEGYDNIDKYSKTVDLPITFPVSCKNFCGPGNTCVITGDQCSNDYDCSGCENIQKMKPPKVVPYYRELSNKWRTSSYKPADAIYITTFYRKIYGI